jgi:RimJ/RimL family protein N-acetyltransferase
MPTILLRNVNTSDLPIFFAQQLDPVANQMAAFPACDRDAFMAHWAKIMAGDNNILQTILYNDQVAGNIVSWAHSDEREVGYWLGREFWGQGIATRALSLFLQEVTSRPLYAYVAKYNLASIRVLGKCGFTISKEDGEEVVLIRRE